MRGRSNHDLASGNEQAAGDRSPESLPLLDGGLVRARRLELGISERQFAASLGPGFSQTVVRNLEAGTNHDTLTMGTVRRVAALLDLPVRRLLRPDAADFPAPVPGPRTLEEHVHQAAALIGGVLCELDRPVSVRALADLADITLDVLPQVLTTLDTTVQPAGLRLHRVSGSVALRPREGVLNKDAVREAWRRHLGRRSLDVGQANLVARAARGETIKAVTNDERVRGGSLVNAGILVRTASGGFALSDDVAFSLLSASPTPADPNAVAG